MTTLTQIIPSDSTLEHVDFSKTDKVHDWRNYVGEFKDCWDELTLREKQIIFIMADRQASNEEWD